MARAGKTYTCPQCGEESIHPVTCYRCDILPVDEHGNPPPPLFERQVLFHKPPDPIVENQANAGADLIAVGGYFFASLARQVRELNTRRRLRARFKTPITPSAAAKDGEAHVRGTVQLLEPVMHRHGGDVAAYLFRIRESNRGSDVAIETQLACGKFLIRDDTGAALVDDDFIAILPKQGDPFPASGNVDVRITDGMIVEVVGPATRRALPELPSVGRAGFREAPKVLVFDGSPDELVVIREVQS